VYGKLPCNRAKQKALLGGALANKRFPAVVCSDFLIYRKLSDAQQIAICSTKPTMPPTPALSSATGENAA
jgi:hypothetical protein